ncbi:MAG TPA: nicotinamide-nucleotide amidohydrolase family protein [Longimicrobiales bacterium]|nr:nicotinamide-nucleotide amidohydrolase family protein [Longimicrobiales bacterium]
MAARLGERLARQGFTLAVAESCSGGLLAARLTDGDGASRFFLAGLTTYSNAAKTALLGVPPEDLAAHGAVSERVARAMAEGARRATGADAALAVTGVAGPGGGTPEKPVGMVWIAAALGDRVEARRFSFAGDRAAVRTASVTAALGLLDALLEEG